MVKTTLVIMAAGIGSRFGGGIKQLAPVGPGGEIIMDYSIYDAMEAGFQEVVFIIRHDLEKDFREVIGSRLEKILPIKYAFQELSDLPEGYKTPKERTKPWGTGQAVLAIKGMVDNPFVVINADDYYGKEAFVKLHDYLIGQQEKRDNTNPYEMCMAGFILKNTLSENGGVTRGVCHITEGHTLQKVKETYDIEYRNGKLMGFDDDNNDVELDENSYVSMNMWGMYPCFLQELERGFKEFLSQVKEGDIKAEYLLPKIVDRMLREGRANVQVLETKDKWFGVTYQEDKQSVANAIQSLVAQGVYKDKLFS